MNLSDEERKALVALRVQKAHDTWKETQEIIASELWHAAANRMYYACYYITSALLISKGYNPTTHTGVIRLLGLHFVSTGLLEPEMGKLYQQLFELRQTGDYDDWIVVGEDDVLPKSKLIVNYFEAIINLINSK